MKIDYKKKEYNKEEIRIMNSEAEYLKERNPNHIPILIQIDSNVLNIDKQKFLVSESISFMDFINNSLRKKLINLYNNDVLVVNSIKFSGPIQNRIVEIKNNSKSMMEIYDEHKDTETNLLILRLNRNTTYKYIKSYVKYFSGF